MTVGPRSGRFPVLLYSRELSRNTRNYQLAGHDPGTPWWATPVGIGIAIVVLSMLLALL